jgi:signal transduction histidine kinase
MAAMVAHEIRNPLGGIKGFASLLERDLSDQPELAHMANAIVEGTDDLNRLVSHVLNYTRTYQLHFESLDIFHILAEIRDLLLADPSLNFNLKINIDSALSSLFIPLDAYLIRSALLNLFVNAIQAMPNGGVITIRVSSAGKEAMIEIQDTGIGIEEELIEKIFTPFFTTKQDGNGFGLAETHKVILAHNGEIDVASKLGEGTTFKIKLPLQA